MRGPELERFLRILETIYGPIAVDSITECVEPNTLSCKNPNKIGEFLSGYTREDGEGCQKCKQLIPAEPFSERLMDFPSWQGLLDFSKYHVKQLMIIGEDVSPKIPYVLNIAYGLSIHEISDEGVVAEEKRNKLWEHLKTIFSDRLDLVKRNIYVTDIAKCNSKTENENKTLVWDRCSKNFLLREIELINPKVIIFQGKNAYEYAKCLPTLKMKEEDISAYFGKNSFPKYGKILLQKREITFMRIYHTSNANQRHNYRNKGEDFRRLVKDKILPIID